MLARSRLLLRRDSVRSSKPRQADDAVHRRADFVAHHGEEFRFGAGGGLCLLARFLHFDHRRAEHAERARHAADLVAPLQMRRLDVALAASEAKHHLGHGIQRHHDVADQQEGDAEDHQHQAGDHQQRALLGALDGGFRIHAEHEAIGGSDLGEDFQLFQNGVGAGLAAQHGRFQFTMVGTHLQCDLGRRQPFAIQCPDVGCDIADAGRDAALFGHLQVAEKITVTGLNDFNLLPDALGVFGVEFPIGQFQHREAGLGRTGEIDALQRLVIHPHHQVADTPQGQQGSDAKAGSGQHRHREGGGQFAPDGHANPGPWDTAVKLGRFGKVVPEPAEFARNLLGF
jgi:hypothetical protein